MHHRRRCISSLLLLLPIAAGPATRPSTEPDHPAAVSVVPIIKLADFTSNEFRFRLRYPADWIVLEHPVNNQVFSLQTEPVNAADANLGVAGLRIDTGPEGTSDVQSLKNVSDAIVDYLFNHGGKKISIKTSALGTLDARQVTVTNEHSTGDTQAMYVIAVHQRIEYVFTIAGPADEFVKMQPKVDLLLKSFELME